MNPKKFGKISQITSTIPSTLGKTFKFGVTGLSKTTAANLVSGRVDVLPFGNATELSKILLNTGNHQALCSSLPVSGVESVSLVTKKELAENPNSGAITRSKEGFNFPFGQAGAMALDYDPPQDGVGLDRKQLWAQLCSVIPSIKDAGVVWWCSGSSYIYSGENEIQGLRGQRLYVLVNDLNDTARCGGALAKRLWLMGQGSIAISKSGAKLVRSTFDTSMHECARLDFIGGAVCHTPLEQRRGEPLIMADGGWLDTSKAIPDLTAEEEGRYFALLADAKLKAEGASLAARELWLSERLSGLTNKLVNSGLPQDQAVDRAEHCLRSALGGVLHGDFEITLDDDSIVSIGVILDNREEYHGRLTKDPLEPDYQNGKIVGKLYLFGATPNLNSFARGGSVYKLRRQPLRLYVVKGQRHELVDSIISSLSKDGDIFVKGGQLVQIGQDSIQHLKKSALAHAIGSRIALYTKNAKGIDCPTDVTGDTCEMVSAMADGLRFRDLKAFVTLPFVRADGSIVVVPGYDAQTCTYADFLTGSFLPIPKEPTRSEVVEALRTLWRPWCKFPFATENDRGAMLSAIITAICRPSLDTAPGYFFDAPVQGSGKSLCAAALGALVRGKLGGVSPFVGGEHADSEMLKQIVSMLLAGNSFWLIDNVIGTWKSAVMSALITDGAIDGRVLGSNTWVRGEARMTVCATGNNASLDKDLGRRFVKVRIDSGEEIPQGRDFDFHPVNRALDERLDIARAVLVVVHAFVRAGKPVLGRGTAGFSAWSALVRQCVLWASSEGMTHEAGIGVCGDPATSILEDAGADDEDTIALCSLLRGLAIMYPQKQKFQAKDLFHILNFGISAEGNGVGSVIEALGTMLHNQKNVNTITIGKLLRYRRERLAGGLKLTDAGKDRGKVQLWSVVPAS